MEPSLKQLKYLLAVSEWGHFGKAAFACNVTQSTLSAAIQDLEKILEAQLFERTKKKVLITPTGQAVIDKAREVLQGTQDLIEIAANRTNDQDLSGKLKLAVIPTIAPFLLPPLLAQLRKHFEVNRYYIVLAALKALADEGTLPADKAAEAIAKYAIDADKINPLYA